MYWLQSTLRSALALATNATRMTMASRTVRMATSVRERPATRR
jgi:hypothetical protein